MQARSKRKKRARVTKMQASIHQRLGSLKLDKQWREVKEVYGGGVKLVPQPHQFGPWISSTQFSLKRV